MRQGTRISISLLSMAALSVMVPEASAANQSSIFLYRVADVGKPGVPTLSSAQLKWLNRIEHTPYFKARLATLWFTMEKPYIRGSAPLIVFDAHSTERAVVEGKSKKGWLEKYWVIGQSCNTYYQPGVGEFAMPSNDPACESGKARVL